MNASGSPSPHGFVVVRGRGYRQEQVERQVARLSRDRDAAWERAARLTVLAKDMEAEAAEVRERAAGLAPQTYESLGKGAQNLLTVVEEEVAAVAVGARDDAQALHGAAEAEAAKIRDAARAYADKVLADAEACAQQLLNAAQATADEARIAARRYVKEVRSEAVGMLKETRQRTAALLAAQREEHAERWEAVGRELAGHEALFDARYAELTAHAEGVLADAKRALAEAEEAARHGQEDAEAQAAELLAQARVSEERIARETERVLREHEEAGEEMQAHMTHVRTSLATLTGRATAEG